MRARFARARMVLGRKTRATAGNSNPENTLSALAYLCLRRKSKFNLITSESTQVDHALVEDQVLALDALQDAAGLGVFVEVEGLQCGWVG